MSTEIFIPYARQSLDETDLQAVSEALKQQLITRGEKVEEFENQIAWYCNAKYAVAFNSGTSALSAAYYAAQLTRQDRILTTPNTFVGTIAYAWDKEATIRLMDIDRSTGNLDIDQLKANINQESTRGREIIVPVHFSGIPVDVQAINANISMTETVIIEDAAHALGSTYLSGEKIGSCLWSDMTIFSFHPAKLITTGEGGMVTTNNEEYRDRLLSFRNNGIHRKADNPFGSWYYEVLDTTGNYNFTEFQAALGISQFHKIEAFIQKRKLLASLYRKLLSNINGLALPDETYHDCSAWHIFVVQIDFNKFNIDRAAFTKMLKENGIGTQLHYIPIYRHPFFQERAGDISEYFPEMEGYYRGALTLPLFYRLREEEVEFICKVVKDGLGIR